MSIDADPLVSVIIPSYNRLGYLREAIESVLHQTYLNLEILIVDDGSTDETREYVAGLAGEQTGIVYIPLKHTGLIAAVRNAGLREANGEYIAFLDSDDLWCRDKIEKQLRVMKGSHATWVCSNAYVLHDDAGSAKKLLHKPTDFVSGNVTEKIILKYFVVSSSVILHRSILDTSGVFDETVKRCEDHEYFLRVSMTNSLAAIPEPLVYYRVHATQKTFDPKEDLFRQTTISLDVFDSKSHKRYHNAVALKKSNLWTKIAVQQALGGNDDFKRTIILSRLEDKNLWVSKCLYFIRSCPMLFKLASRMINAVAP